jgi:sec-independent protein translocase protein TatC
MGGMGLPLILLYFLGIALCKYLPLGRPLGAEGYDPVA